MFPDSLGRSNKAVFIEEAALEQRALVVIAIRRSRMADNLI
jgi:hypothetical protein